MNGVTIGVMMEGVSCPDCVGTKLEKYGKTAAGKQKFRCLNHGCRRQFVAGSDHAIDRKTKSLVLDLLAQKIHPAKIAKAIPGISERWLYELRRRHFSMTAVQKKVPT